ncbi:MAG: DUF87 domain-containing protein [Gammaproteobacteria bacterium]|nr:DUF87 domain-containing protein [Gammaproteobacteria bacterium]
MLKISRELSLPLEIAGEANGIVATRGAGKSFTSAVIVEELYRAGIQFCVLDPTGSLIADLLVDTGQSLILDTSRFSHEGRTDAVRDGLCRAAVPAQGPGPHDAACGAG